MESDKSEIPDILYTYKKISDNTYHQILNEYLWASSPKEFNDIFDCGLHYQILPLIMELVKMKENEQKTQEVIEHLLARQRIICFTDMEKNPTMWAHYAENYSGICIGWRTQHIKDSIYKVKYVAADKMLEKYSENIPNMGNPVDIEKALEYVDVLKLNSWEYESEFRYIKAYLDNELPDNKIHCEIKNIIYGLNTPEKAKDIIFHLVKNNRSVNENIRIFQLVQDKKRLMLNIVPYNHDKQL